MKTIAEMAKIWDMSTRQLRYLIKTNKIEGVQLVGKTYMIPDNAKNPNSTAKEELSINEENLIFIATKYSSSLLFKSIVYNLKDDMQNFCVFTKDTVSDCENQFKLNKLNEMIEKYSPSLVVCGECDTPVNYEKSKILCINQKFNNSLKDVSQIYNYSLPKEEDFTSHGLQMYFKEGICRAIYAKLIDSLNNQQELAIGYNLMNQTPSPMLRQKLPTVQASYSLLCKRLDEATPDDNITNVSIWNEVEYSDSNNEINYYSHILSAIERGVSIDFVYINEAHTIEHMKNNFAIKAISNHLSEKARFFMLEKSKLNDKVLQEISEGFIVYSNKSIYCDEISPYSLGRISARKEDIEKYSALAEKLKKMSMIISSKEEWIKNYGV